MLVNRNRLANVNNKFQGERKRVLCVCSAGLLRSPTAAWVLSNEPFGFNTRSVGTSQEYSLFPMDAAHLYWADEIVVMDSFHEAAVKELLGKLDDNARGFESADNSEKPVHVLNIEDDYGYREPELVDIMNKKFSEIFGVTNE